VEFLVEPANNSKENCVAVSRFVFLDLTEDPQTRAAIACLPDELKLIIEDMGSFLDDVHTAPDIARSFESTPKQLLERLQRFQDGLTQGR
jgi:hypothetical protein